MELTNKHALVTGASSGIGAAIARELAAKGARVTLVARREAALEKLAEKVAEESDERAAVVAADLTEDPDWLDRVREANGPVDVLVNNAGVQVIGPTWEVDREAGERSLLLNLTVPLRLIREVLPGMVERGEGAIVNIASMASLAPTPSMIYYNASKGGIAGASEGLRAELAPHGVSVLTVYPGIIADTDMAASGLAAYRTTAMLRAQPKGTSPELARRVVRGVERDRARVIYPGMNALARWFPGTTRWVMDRFTPRLAVG